MKDGLYHIKVTVNFDESKDISEGFLIGDGGAVCVKLQPVTVPRGHWIDRPDLRHLLSIPEAYVCSECGKSAIKRHNFCNRCGAKMDEGKHNGLNPDIVIIDESEVPRNG